MRGEELRAEVIIREIKRAGIRFIVTLPDRVTSAHLLPGLQRDSTLRVVQVCKEDEGISICSGLFCAGQRALLLMQHTGLLDSVNALRGVAVEGENPVCMLVGLLGMEAGVAPRRSASLGVRVVEPILDVLGIEHHLIEATPDVAKVVPAVERAYARPAPVALLVGREPV